MRKLIIANQVAYELKGYAENYDGEISENMAAKLIKAVDILDEIRSEVIECNDR